MHKKDAVNVGDVNMIGTMLVIDAMQMYVDLPHAHGRFISYSGKRCESR